MLPVSTLVFIFTLSIAVVVITRHRPWSRHRYQFPNSHIDSSEKSTSVGDDKENEDGNPPKWGSGIEPLDGFDWRATPPLKLRPFKPIFNVTMAIQNSTPSDLIVMDCNYLDRVTGRRQLIDKHGSLLHGATPSGAAAVQELYTYLLGTYLPTRYPSMFTIKQEGVPGPELQPPRTIVTVFHNKVTDRTFPLSPPRFNPSEMLRILGETVEEDMFLLLRDQVQSGEGNSPNKQEHRSVAFVCCHPAGFDPSEKLGMRLAEIHGPVPGYEKIGASMERYFARLEIGRSVKRVNWSIQTHPNLYAPSSSGNHIYTHPSNQHQPTDQDQNQDNHQPHHQNNATPQPDPQQAIFRVERQTLTRLPQTRAILFSFKTYMYPLSEIREEGLGPQLADAIEGLQKGNAPGMWVYKGGVKWGESLKGYLRG
ncbi:uncharacterized protein C8A04DRAFT_12809 [Dichotomopilus funicola]|uniref:Uncharacterized protein n=1 Tax=Dichotomopilus funicola TaxID=1934379 RepID=A0AAN6V1T6_9PEZI|nr:hypothetical protein C8A04DRAFT_12809 [Dichotomopilus funicola]